jgi:hypothetical protein
MLTINITNVSSTDALLAADLPAPFNLNGDIAASGNKDFVVQVHDLDKVVDNHSGFTSADILQQMKQGGLLTVNIADVGDSEDNGSMYDHAVATAAA